MRRGSGHAALDSAFNAALGCQLDRFLRSPRKQQYISFPLYRFQISRPPNLDSHATRVSQWKTLPTTPNHLRNRGLPAATDEPMRQTVAFKALADSSNGLTNLNRYLARAERLYHRALSSLLALRKLELVEAKASQPKEIKSSQTNPCPNPPGGHLPWTDPQNRTSDAIHLRMITPKLPDPPSPSLAG